MPRKKTEDYAVNRPVPARWPGGERGKVQVVIVGEAPGADEARTGEPFVGASGRLLNRALQNVGIDRDKCLVTNVFSFKPINNEVGRFFTKRREAKALMKEGWEPVAEPFGTHGYMAKDREWELERLAKELIEAAPNVVIALGATALWALTGQHKISVYRGTWLEPRPGMGSGFKVMPTYHPAAIMRNWDNRPLFDSDLMKAGNERHDPEIRRENREIWIEPTLADLEEFEHKHLTPHVNTGQPLAFDIETADGQMTCIGIAPNREVALVLPFWDNKSEDNSYWPTTDQEVKAWQWLKRILEDDRYTWLAHNMSYDVIWLAYKYGIKVAGKIEDTMHMHHALQPELLKGLGFLGSVYTNEGGAWKDMVSHGNKRGNKRDE